MPISSQSTVISPIAHPTAPNVDTEIKECDKSQVFDKQLGSVPSHTLILVQPQSVSSVSSPTDWSPLALKPHVGLRGFIHGAITAYFLKATIAFAIWFGYGYSTYSFFRSAKKSRCTNSITDAATAIVTTASYTGKSNEAPFLQLHYFRSSPVVHSAMDSILVSGLLFDAMKDDAIHLVEKTGRRHGAILHKDNKLLQHSVIHYSIMTSIRCNSPQSHASIPQCHSQQS